MAVRSHRSCPRPIRPAARRPPPAVPARGRAPHGLPSVARWAPPAAWRGSTAAGHNSLRHPSVPPRGRSVGSPPPGHGPAGPPPGGRRRGTVLPAACRLPPAACRLPPAPARGRRVDCLVRPASHTLAAVPSRHRAPRRTPVGQAPVARPGSAETMPRGPSRRVTVPAHRGVTGPHRRAGHRASGPVAGGCARGGTPRDTVGGTARTRANYLALRANSYGTGMAPADQGVRVHEYESRRSRPGADRPAFRISGRRR